MQANLKGTRRAIFDVLAIGQRYLPLSRLAQSKECGPLTRIEGASYRSSLERTAAPIVHQAHLSFFLTKLWLHV